MKYNKPYVTSLSEVPRQPAAASGGRREDLGTVLNKILPPKGSKSEWTVMLVSRTEH